MRRMQFVTRQSWCTRLMPWLSGIAQFVTLTIVATASLWPVPFEADQLFAVWSQSDLAVSHWPAALLIQRTFAQDAHLPLWNPYFGGGLPLTANPLAALFYPPTHLVHFLSLRNYYLVLILGHLVLAGAGMLLLARRAFGLPRFPALVAAISYMATPKMLAHLGAGHITMIQTVAWYPWLALACWATVREPRRWGAFLCLCITLTLLAGHPQMAYYGLLMTACLAGWLLVKRWRKEGWRAQCTPIAGLAAAAIIAILLAAIYLSPLVELLALSSRQTSINVGDVFPLLSFLRNLISQPSSGAGWETMVAPGWTVLALMLLALVKRWPKVWPLALGIVLVVGLALGNASPLYWVMARMLPELSSFRGVARIWFVALVQIALLAGSGSDILLGGIRRAIDVILRRVQQGIPPIMRIISILVVFGVAFSLVGMDVGYTRVNNVSLIATPSNLARAAAQLAGSGKIYDEQENILQSSAVALSVPLANGQDPLLIQSYISYMQRAGGYTRDGYNLRIPYDSPKVQPDAMLLGLIGVSVVVSQRPLTDSRLVLIKKVDGTLIYKNTAYAGPAYLVRTAPGGQQPSLDRIQRLQASVRTLTMTDEQSAFAFSSGIVAYIVLAATAFPGWTANLDGHAVSVQMIAGVLPAVKIGPGAHTLRYSYSPLSVYNGTIFSIIGLLAVLVWFVLGCCLKSGRQRRSRARRCLSPASRGGKRLTGGQVVLEPARIAASTDENIL